MHTEIIFNFARQFWGDRNVTLVDGDPVKKGSYWRGLEVRSPKSLDWVDWSNSQLLISSYGSQEIILEEAAGLGIPRESIVTLYDSNASY